MWLLYSVHRNLILRIMNGTITQYLLSKIQLMFSIGVLLCNGPGGVQSPELTCQTFVPPEKRAVLGLKCTRLSERQPQNLSRSIIYIPSKVESYGFRITSHPNLLLLLIFLLSKCSLFINSYGTFRHSGSSSKHHYLRSAYGRAV